MESNSKKIKVNTINYRKGFIEVTPGIHDGCVNVEVWNIHPDKDIKDISIGMEQLEDSDFIGNVEVELNELDVRELIKILEDSLAQIK